ncbi:uncharacterized protein METZ01_LOCUS252388 [marine metagenome]|uniref:Uncharacterized protein n=1 Tax=marine metagenome TaxID=408172 RepID=A0A382IIE9_9ZZZZ
MPTRAHQVDLQTTDDAWMKGDGKTSQVIKLSQCSRHELETKNHRLSC